MTSPAIFTLGARGSPLALAQANEARRRLAKANGWETSGSRFRSYGPLAIRSRIGRSPMSGARACSPRKSTLRSSRARSTPQCTRPRTCLRSCLTASQSPPICRVRTCATRLSRRWPTRSRACRTGRRSGPLRCAVKPRRCACVRTSSPRSYAAMSRRDLAKAEFGRGRRDAARARRLEAARPRPSRSRRARRR